MATIDFSTEPVANPASPPTGWSQPAWSDNARVDGTPSFSWLLSSGSEAQWFFDTVQPTGAYSETTFYAVNTTSRGPILADASGNGYGLLCNSTNIRVFLYTSGSLVSLVHTSVGAAVATDTFRLQCNGTGDFSVLKNDVEISTFNDVTHTGPFYGGLFSRDGGAGISDVTVDAVASVSITPANMTDGESGVALNPVGLGTLTSWTIDGVATTGTDTTINNLDIATLASESGTAGPKIGTVTIEVSDGTNTVSAQVTNRPKAGYAATDIVTPDTIDAEALYTLMNKPTVGLTIATDDQFYYPTANSSVINDDGTYNMDPVPYSFYYQDDTNSKWYDMTMIIEADSGGGDAPPVVSVIYTRYNAIRETTKLAIQESARAI